MDSSDLDPTWFLGPTRVSLSNGISIGSVVLAYTTGSAAKTSNAFQWRRQPPKIAPFPLGISTPKIHMVPWAHPTQPPNSISISSGRFRKAHERDQQTDTD